MGEYEKRHLSRAEMLGLLLFGGIGSLLRYGVLPSVVPGLRGEPPMTGVGFTIVTLFLVLVATSVGCGLYSRLFTSKVSAD